MMRLELFAVPTERKPGRRHVYLYDVLLDGDPIITSSRDPECDLARALLACGITGMVEVVDGKTGKPRSRVNVERAAKMQTEEGPHGPRFVKRRETVVERPSAGERDLPRGEMAEAA